MVERKKGPTGEVSTKLMAELRRIAGDQWDDGVKARVFADGVTVYVEGRDKRRVKVGFRSPDGQIIGQTTSQIERYVGKAGRPQSSLGPVLNAIAAETLEESHPHCQRIGKREHAKRRLTSGERIRIWG